MTTSTSTSTSTSLDRARLLAIPEFAWPTVLLAIASVSAFVALAIAAASGAIPWWLATPLQGVLAFVAFTPMHDASHRSVARAGWLNELVGWACATVLLAPFSAFRHVHLEHHRHTNDAARDPDMWSGGGPAWQRPLRWATQDFFYYGWYALRLRERPVVEVAGTLLGFALTYGPLALSMTSGHAVEVLLFWALPARIGIVLLAFAFDWLPHHPHSVRAAVDPMRATSILEHRALTPVLLSQNYHLVHHLYPGVPFYRYGRVWWALREQLVARGAWVRRIGAPDVALPVRAASADAMHELVVLEVIDETPDTKSFLLGVPGSLRESFRFRAGQHAHVEVVIDGAPVRRTYSFSRRADGDVARVTVKRVPGGRVSGFLHAHLGAGDTLRVSLPRGRFVRREGARPLVALAAGSGITPVRALIEETLVETLREVHVFYASRDRANVIFDREIAELARVHPGRLHVRTHLDAEHGIPEADALASFLAPLADADVYVCGPAPFVALAERAIEAARVDVARVSIERFVPAADRTRREVQGRAARLRVLRDGESLELAVGRNETLLQAARRSGVALPSSCEDGYCGACTTRLTSGTVAMRCSDALSEAELAAGSILPCQAVATSERVVIAYDAPGT